MTLAPTLPWPSVTIHHKALLFAQESGQDLDFDDELENIDDYYDPKPPNRRPLVLILLLLIVASVG